MRLFVAHHRSSGCQSIHEGLDAVDHHHFDRRPHRLDVQSGVARDQDRLDGHRELYALPFDIDLQGTRHAQGALNEIDRRRFILIARFHIP